MTSPMVIRTVAAWLAILVLAMLNGALRQALLIRLIGEQAGQVVSTLLLVALIGGAAWVMLPWIRPLTRRDAWLVGVVWLLLTLAFEFLAGHYLFGDSWETLLTAYDITGGRIWILVPVITLVAPVLVHRSRGRTT